MSVLLMTTVIIAKINWQNYALFNRIGEMTSVIFMFILLCFIFLIQINIGNKIKYVINSFFILVLLCSLFLFFFSRDLCNEEIISRSVSGNDQYQLFIIQKNCGATTDYEYRILLQETGTFLPKEKIIFQSYSYPVPRQVTFLNDNKIQISCQSAGDKTNFMISFDEKTLNTDKTLLFYSGDIYE
ncbi:DUF5412 [Desulfonema magnum]|uniref:DUF5412 n=1 Tax=Desulfonema magnum TaxID=45655 RepID=A0A975BIA6_9BACT|nr:DUF5412 [Desulfonema magnum]